MDAALHFPVLFVGLGFGLVTGSMHVLLGATCPANLGPGAGLWVVRCWLVADAAQTILIHPEYFALGVAFLGFVPCGLAGLHPVVLSQRWW